MHPHVFFLFTETYEIVHNAYCNGDSILTKLEYQSLNTLQEAKEYCAQDKECLSVQDYGCNGLGPFTLCRHFYSQYDIWCQHKNVLSHSMYKMSSIFE